MRTKAEKLVAGDIYHLGMDEFCTEVSSDEAVTLLVWGPRLKEVWESRATLARGGARRLRGHEQASLDAPDATLYLKLPFRKGVDRQWGTSIACDHSSGIYPTNRTCALLGGALTEWDHSFTSALEV